MNEDFTEEEFEDDLPEGVEFAEPVDPVPKEQRGEQREQRERVQQQQQQQPQPQKPATEPRGRGRPRTRVDTPAASEKPVERFTPFIMPKRIGVLDNDTQQPLMEDQDTNTLLLGLITKLLNDVDDIKKNL